MKKLTKAEEEIMQIVWDLQLCFVNDIIEKLSHPKPAYNTVSTIVRILERKGFVSHNVYGNTHQYFPVVTKEDYSASLLKGIIQSYFGNSYKQMVSFFSKDKDISLKELEEIKELMENQINKFKDK